jgi:hypothetical protein
MDVEVEAVLPFGMVRRDAGDRLLGLVDEEFVEATDHERLAG